jgi:hypothetical protein
MRRVWLRSQRRIVATFRGKFNGKPMTYATHKKYPASYVSYNPPKHNAIVKTVGILRRIFEAILHAMHESRRSQAEREIAKFVALRGGPITDDLEREMTRRMFTSNWSPRE